MTSVNTLRIDQRVTRRHLLVAAGIGPALAVLLAACGDPDAAGTDDGGTTPGTNAGTATPTTGGPTTAAASTTDGRVAAVRYSTDPNTAVVRVSYEGGFVPQSVAFAGLPVLLISGDGRAFTPAPTTMQYPGDLVDTMNVQPIPADGIQAVLQSAQAAGLLGEIPDYSSQESQIVTDVGNTVVRITANEQTFVHSAYALGFGADGTDGPEATPARQALFDFVTALQALETVAGAGTLGEQTTFAPTDYRFMATVYADGTADAPTDPAQNVVEWPVGAGIPLADASTCAIASVEHIGSVVEDATDETLFRENDILYSLAIAPVLPGDPGCTAA